MVNGRGWDPVAGSVAPGEVTSQRCTVRLPARRAADRGSSPRAELGLHRESPGFGRLAATHPASWPSAGRAQRPRDLVRLAELAPTGTPVRPAGRGGAGWRATSTGWYVAPGSSHGSSSGYSSSRCASPRRCGHGMGGRCGGRAPVLRRHLDGAATCSRSSLLADRGARPLGRRSAAAISRAARRRTSREFVERRVVHHGTRATFDEVDQPASHGRGWRRSAWPWPPASRRSPSWSPTPSRPAWEGIPLYRKAVALSNECFRSGPEVYLPPAGGARRRLPGTAGRTRRCSTSGRLLGYPRPARRRGRGRRRVRRRRPPRRARYRARRGPRGAVPGVRPRVLHGGGR